MQRPPLVRSHNFFSKVPFITIERFICHINLTRCVQQPVGSRIALLYIGQPIKLTKQSSLNNPNNPTKTLIQIAYNECSGKDKQWIFNHKQCYPNLFKLVDDEHRLLKKNMHNELFKIDNILDTKFVRRLCFPILD